MDHASDKLRRRLRISFVEYICHSQVWQSAFSPMLGHLMLAGLLASLRIPCLAASIIGLVPRFVVVGARAKHAFLSSSKRHNVVRSVIP
jgi:hypothetical protein